MPNDTPVTLRPLVDGDLPMLHGWLNRPHIAEWWGGGAARPTLAEVRAEYRPQALAAASVTPYIAMLGAEPIGYAQTYVALGSGDGWWPDETDPGVRGIDQSLADPAQLGKGLGTRLVRALVEHLFSDPAVTKIQTDPAPGNLRAIRCYTKAGFTRLGTIDTPDGPAVYMVQTRQAFEAAQPQRLRVARLRASDAAPYRALMLHAYAAAADAFTSTPEERAAAPDAWWVQRIADPAGNTLAFGAFHEGRLIGTVALEFSTKPKTRHKALLIGMFVHESARGLGAGAALVAAALEAARRREGTLVITLTVTEGNLPAIRLYERAGFEAFGTEPMAIATPTGLKGKVHMWLRLQPVG